MPQLLPDTQIFLADAAAHMSLIAELGAQGRAGSGSGPLVAHCVGCCGAIEGRLLGQQQKWPSAATDCAGCECRVSPGNCTPSLSMTLPLLFSCAYISNFDSNIALRDFAFGQ